eukprot:g8181.t1
MEITKSKSETGITSTPLSPMVPFDTGAVLVSSDQFRSTHTWTIRRFSEIKERKILSGEFEIGTYNWRLLIFPNGNDNRDREKNRTVAIYLCFSHAHFTPDYLSPKVNFEITVVNQHSPERSITLGAHHTFSKRSPDWGFTRILLKEDLQQPEIGFLINDTLVLHAHLTVIPRRMPRNETGFVGLSGRGAQDDGLNAALQVLFHIPYFRKAIYSINSAETLAVGTRLPHALRRLFFKMQYQHSTVSTKEISKVLDNCEPKKRFTSLLDKLMLELMGCNVEKVIPNLFEGQSFNSVENPATGESKTSHETHKRIDLTIDNCKDLYEALEKRCKVTKVEGSTGEHQYTLFDILPSILHLDLKISDYKSIHDSHNEPCGGFVISEDLNMDYGGKRFFSSNSSNKTVKNTYKLHSMFISTMTGCHFVYIRRQDTWFRFEDEQVFQVDKEEVFKAHCRNGEQVVDSLIYIRTSDMGQIMWETGKDDIAEPLRKLFEDCLYEKEKDLEDKQTANTHILVNIATEFDFKKKSVTRMPTELIEMNSANKFRVSRDASFEDFRNMVSNEYDVPPSAQRYWLLKTNEGNSSRVERLFPSLGQENKKMIALHTVRDVASSSDKRNNALMVVNLYLELPQSGKINLHEIKPDELLLFVKFYDSLHAEMEYIGSLFVSKRERIGDILRKAKALSNLPKDLVLCACKIAAYEPSIVLCELFDQSTPEKNELRTGDVVIIQPKMKPLNEFLKERYSSGVFGSDFTLAK